MDIGNNESLNYSTQMFPKSQFGRANVVVDEIKTIEPNHHWASPMGRAGNEKIQISDITGVIY